jgi:hypothetical protein
VGVDPGAVAGPIAFTSVGLTFVRSNPELAPESRRRRGR